jgi:thiol:disulfide interchange protein DsbD
MKKLILFLFSVGVLFGFGGSFLMPDKAFIPHVKLNDKMQIEADIKIADGIYIYDSSLKFNLKDADGIEIAEVKKPSATLHDGDMVYLKTPNFLITLKNSAKTTQIKKIVFELSYQGCSTAGLCYEPYTKSYSFDIDTSKLSSQKTEPILKTLVKKDVQVDKDVQVSESDAIADTIKNGSVALILATFLGFGLLLALTPCVFPMIPIISGVIISQGKGITTFKAFMLSLVYVLSMAVAYTIAGVMAGLFGSNLQAALQTPWVIYSFSGVFVALAFSMFGFYELKLPDSLVSKVSSNSSRTGYIGVAIMGFLSALIVGPCVAAPLAGALVYIGQTGDALLGGMALFAMSIGMGLPLIVVGVSAGKFMPKPGMWMTMVSVTFGVMMLGVAIWMLERVVDEYITMLLYAILGIGFSIYLGALERGGHIFKKSIAVVLFAYSLALLMGVLGGSKSMARPLEFLKPQAVTSIIKNQSRHVEFTKVTSIKELDSLLEKNSGKKIMLDFYATWCTSCKELEEVTFADERVKAKMDDFVLIQADITQNTQVQKDLSKKYGVFGPPVILFFDESGKVLKSKTIVGFIEPDKFLESIDKI